ncbi:hypothetical protein ACFV4F_24915, partial [Kitasatospora sp. NPDC059722]
GEPPPRRGPAAAPPPRAPPPAVPVMAIERTYYDQATGRPVETADIVLLGSRWVSEYGRRPQH